MNYSNWQELDIHVIVSAAKFFWMAGTVPALGATVLMRWTQPRYLTDTGWQESQTVQKFAA